MTDSDPLWYKDAIIYQLHVRAFQDSLGDGIGDFRGLKQRLDYLADLGVTTVWLLPFYPSPLKDDGYDIADYTGVHPHYGTLRDFREFLDAAHDRGLRVITELVVNHTSDQHPWFQRARRAPRGSPERDFYVWSDTTDRYKEARIIFKDFERSNWTFDPVAGQYFWHRFYSHQPDLNFDNPAVWGALTPVLDFWLGMGVDGMRLDAIPYLFEREGTNCENLPETHQFLKYLRRHMDDRFPGRMFLAEANQWPEDAIAYFGGGDECHMAFHFPVMPRLYMALHQEDRFPIIDILEQTPPIPDNCQWCMFLRNHDELTLEMVTDEERDYMYRAYATDPQARVNLGIRRRLAPLLRNDRRRIELMNALLFSMPGTPVVYYGDEIGMGDNIYLGDRNGVRTPMQWSSDRNAGFSRANPQKLYLPVIIDPEYHYESVNVEAQQGNASSLLWWMKRLIALRKQFKAFGRGTIEFLRPDNPKILAFIRRYSPTGSSAGGKGLTDGEEVILVVANLSRYVQYVELNLGEFKGLVPYELFGRTPFPPIGELPYLLTVGPHGFYWFALGPAPVRSGVVPMDVRRETPIPRVAVRRGWDELIDPARFDWLEPALKDYMTAVAAQTGKPRPVRDVRIREAVRLPLDLPSALMLLEVEFRDGDTQLRALPLGYASGEGAMAQSGAVVASVGRAGERVGVLYDARTDPGFCAAVLQAIAGHTRLPLSTGELVATSYQPFEDARGPEEVPQPITIQRGEQHNVSINYGNRLILKSYERLEHGSNPDLELGRFLTDHTTFNRAAPVVGSVELHLPDAEPITLSVLFGYVPNEGDAWQYTLGVLSRFYDAALTSPHAPPAPAPADAWTPGANTVPPADTRDLIDGYIETAERLGAYTAEMHRALASGTDIPAIAPEPFGKLYQRSIYQGMRTRTGLVFRELTRKLRELPEEIQALSRRLLAAEQTLLRRYRAVLGSEVTGYRIRIHGNYHLAELLYTGTDFVVIDFEGDPGRPLSERRIKRSPLRDVAGMMRSFEYAALGPVYGLESGRGTFPGHVREEDRDKLLRWARFWSSWAAARFVQAYFAGMEGSGLLPSNPAVCRELLELYVLERGVVDLGNELVHRPEWIPVPLTGLLGLLEDTGG
jgi:maltose alpha-D-glucosyltransferase/alpha-amylase